MLAGPIEQKTRQSKALRLGILSKGKLNKKGRPEEIIAIVNERKIDIFGLIETKLTGQGKKS
jgi:hypothetical protein